MLAFLAVLVLLLFVAPVTLFLIGWFVGRTPRRTGRVIVSTDKTSQATGRLKAN